MKPKDTVSIVIGRLKKDMGYDKGSSGASEPEEDGGTGLEACSSDIIRAVKEGDAGALAKALQHFLEVASVEESDDDVYEE